MKLVACILSGMSLVAAAQDPPVDTIERPNVGKIEDPLGGAFRASETTLDDQTDVAVTIYNNNLALVKDRRAISLFPGEMTLRFMDVSQHIKPETVSMRSITTPGALRILEQNYEYDLIGYEKLMEKYVGKNVKLINFSDSIGFVEKDAKLVSYNQNRPIYEIDGQIFLNHPGSVTLPEIPENLIAKPSLIWLLDNQGTDQEIEVTYLTEGIAWRSDYVIVLDDKEGKMDLDSWITLNNNSGTAYTNALLKLVAGDVNIVQRPRARGGVAGREMMMADSASMPIQESFSEFHLYTIPRRTTIKDRQSKQINLFSSHGINVDRVYEYRGRAHYYSQRIQNFAPEKVASYLVFENEEENELGMPLPSGIMRVYQRDGSGALQFSGEDRIGHTPKDESVRLKLGNAFDIVGERVQKEFQRVASTLFESEYEITLRNHKEEDVMIDVVEPMIGDWQIMRSNIEFDKRDAATAVFSVPVPADGETVLTYRVRVRL